jgi:hypothetical protein
MKIWEMVRAAYKENAIRRTLGQQRDGREARNWQIKRQGLTPQSYKRQMIRRIALGSGLQTMVETGTNYGQTVSSCIGTFRQIYSIEFDQRLYEHCVKRFALQKTVRIFQGDSAKVLPEILAKLDGSALFWLDAHYSGEGTGRADIDTPICRELQLIAQHPANEHIILVDDARLFNGTADYPTLEGCREVVAVYWPSHKFVVRDDVIMILPPRFPVTDIL